LSLIPKVFLCPRQKFTILYWEERQKNKR
jgi:hypothetical protein